MAAVYRLNNTVLAKARAKAWDEKSQLLVGVRRAYCQQTSLTSSVLSADSMHIGVLAAAAHAVGNRSPFKVFYNPRACPSEFVIPVGKYRKALFGSQISAGMRFGMMFETEESGKRRYMGTLVGVSDLDPLGWPGSKWRNLQVEWDESGCGDKPTRVSAWEIETPESLFLFPSLASGFKRSFPPELFGLGELYWENFLKRPYIPVPESRSMSLPPVALPSVADLPQEQLINMLMKPQTLNYISTTNPVPCHAVEQAKANLQVPFLQKPQVFSTDTCSLPNNPQHYLDQPELEIDHSFNNNRNDIPTTTSEMIKTEPVIEPVADKNNTLVVANSRQKLMSPQLEPSVLNPSVMDSDLANLNALLPYMDPPDWLQYSSILQSLCTLPQSPNPLSGVAKQDHPSVAFPDGINSPILPQLSHELWDQGLKNTKYSSEGGPLASYANSLQRSTGSAIYSCPQLDRASGSAAIEPSVSNAILGDICGLKDSGFQYTSDCLVGNFSSSQDLQSQITSTSLTESQAFSLQEFPDNSGGTSSSDVDFDESNLLHNSTWQQVKPPLRTYTKVQKAGSVGRSIDVTSFKNYNELCCAIERMFGLEGLLNNPRGSGWKLVYVDFENDVLLIGDDPWDEFVGCVRCIRILSPAEVQQMSEEGARLLNSNPLIQGISHS